MCTLRENYSMKLRLLLPLLIGPVLTAYTQSNPDRWNTDGNLGDTTRYMGTTNAEPIIFKTDSVERMRITSIGRVGINVKKPQAKLDVKGTVQFRQDLRLPGLPAMSNPIDNNYSLLLLDTAGNTMRISYYDLLKKMVPDSYSAPSLPPDMLTVCDIPGYLDQPTWFSAPYKLYSECPDVFVGIGTSNPLVSLDVRGTMSGANLAIGVDPTMLNARLHVKTVNTNPESKLFLVENSSRKLLELDNSGLLRAREIKVDLQSWPDYVFDTKYPLMPLNEVENYIRHEGHLPGVPPARQIETDGLNLAEMNTLLMEKVEELTLYLIAQQKQIEAQNARILELENK